MTRRRWYPKAHPSKRAIAAQLKFWGEGMKNDDPIEQCNNCVWSRNLDFERKWCELCTNAPTGLCQLRKPVNESQESRTKRQ